MFKDYIKLNKLGSVIIAVLLGLFILLEIVFLIVYEMVTNSLHPVSGRWDYILWWLSSASAMLFAIVAAAMFIVAMSTFIGKSRSLLLMHRGRSYYLKIQLVIITMSSLITAILYLVSKIVGVLSISHMSFAYNIPLDIFINQDVLINAICIFCAYIAGYYLVMYAIDIFANSTNRYKSIVRRNVDLLIFLGRSWLIGWLSVMLFASPNPYSISYSNPYLQLVTLSSTFIKGFGVFIYAMLMIVIIVDYMCYFKKKVIV